MSYRDQLLNVFTEDELTLVAKLVEDQHLTSVMSSFSIEERRMLRSVRDKLSGREFIRQSKTSPPGKL